MIGADDPALNSNHVEQTVESLLRERDSLRAQAHDLQHVMQEGPKQALPPLHQSRPRVIAPPALVLRPPLVAPD